jgi:tetratricopeptide (TPR) repeat protein
MGTSALSIKLRCASWEQLSGLYDREIKAGRLFLRSTAPPHVGTELSIDLTLPSGTVIPLVGRVARIINDGPRGTGVDLVLLRVPPSTLWLIESALASAQRRTGSTQAIQAPAPAPPPLATKPFDAGDITLIGDEDGEEAPVDIDIEISEEPETAAAEASLVAALEGELAGMKGLNPFQLLGVGYEATDQEVRSSFGELSKKTHPDRFAQYESERARVLASEMFVLVREAYGKVGTKEGRDAAAAKLRPQTSKPEAGKTLARVAVVKQQPPPIPPAPPPPPPRKLPALSADDLFGDLPDAPPAPTRGAAPVQLDGAVTVSEAERLLASGQHDQALSMFESALRATPGDRGARIGRELALGLRLVTAGDRAAATQHFETVLELDPLHELASRELAAIRRAFTESRKGVLNKLLGRKT